MSFKHKIILTLGLAQTIMLILLDWQAVSFVHSANERELETRGYSLVSFLASDIAKNADSEDKASLENYLKQKSLFSNILFAEVRDKNNNEFARYGQRTNEIHRVFSADINDDRHINIIMSDDDVRSNTGQAIWGVLFMSITQLLVIIIISYYLGTYLSRNINYLRVASEAISKGNLDTYIAIEGQDELSELGLSFNNMIEELKVTRESLTQQIAITTANQEALRTSLNRFDSLVSTIPGVVFERKIHKDGSYSYTFISDESSTLLGIDSILLMNNPKLFLEIIHPFDMQIIRNIYAASVDTGRTETAEFRIYPRNTNELKWLQITMRGVIQNDNTVVWRGILEDATSRKNAEIALRESELRSRWLIENLPLGLLLHDEDEIVFANPAAKKMFGTELVGKRYIDFVDPSASSIIRLRMESIFKDGINTVPLTERKFTLPDGRVLIGEVTVVVTRSLENHPLLQIMITDITKRKAAETELEEYRQKLEDIIKERTRELEFANFALENANDNIFFILPDGAIFHANLSTCLKLGYLLEKIVTLKIWDIDTESTAEKWLLTWSELRKHKQIMSEKTYKKNDGSLYPVEVSITIFSLDDKEIACAFARDISLRKKAEKIMAENAHRLQNALTREQELNTMQRQFASMVSHEFRTPLAIIDGAVMRIRTNLHELNPQDVKLRLERIDNAIKRMTGLIDSTLSASKIDEGAVDPEFIECDIKSIIITTAQTQEELHPSHKIVCRIDDIPDRIIADPRLIQQVLTNLIGNAVKYSPASDKVDIDGYGNNNKIIISISDYGVGIPQDEINKAGERFFRASTSAGIPGTGIGLYIVKKILEIHNGIMEISSLPGKGTKVTITLPVKRI